MTNDMRTPEDIERDIEREREDMRDNINTLQQKFSVDGIMNDVSDMLRERGGDIGRLARQTIGRNPAAVAVIGAGLAWLMLSKDRSDGGATRTGTRLSRNGRSTGSGGTGSGGTDWHGDDMAWLRDDWEDDKVGGGVTGAVKRGATVAVQTARDAVGAVRDKAADLTERLTHGTEDLSEAARDRVMAARRAAYDAQRSLRHSAEVASDAFDNQPLVIGALALAVGAGLGASLPRTRIEDKTLGSSSDTLVSEAQRIFKDEVHKARQSLQAAAQDSTAPQGQQGGLVTPV